MNNSQISIWTIELVLSLAGVGLCTLYMWSTSRIKDHHAMDVFMGNVMITCIMMGTGTFFTSIVNFTTGGLDTMCDLQGAMIIFMEIVTSLTSSIFAVSANYYISKAYIMANHIAVRVLAAIWLFAFVWITLWLSISTFVVSPGGAYCFIQLDSPNDNGSDGTSGVGFMFLLGPTMLSQILVYIATYYESRKIFMNAENASKENKPEEKEEEEEEHVFGVPRVPKGPPSVFVTIETPATVKPTEPSLQNEANKAIILRLKWSSISYAIISSTPTALFMAMFFSGSHLTIAVADMFLFSVVLRLVLIPLVHGTRSIRHRRFFCPRLAPLESHAENWNQTGNELYILEDKLRLVCSVKEGATFENLNTKRLFLADGGSAAAFAFSRERFVNATTQRIKSQEKVALANLSRVSEDSTTLPGAISEMNEGSENEKSKSNLGEHKSMTKSGSVVENREAKVRLRYKHILEGVLLDPNVGEWHKDLNFLSLVDNYKAACRNTTELTGRWTIGKGIVKHFLETKIPSNKLNIVDEESAKIKAAFVGENAVETHPDVFDVAVMEIWGLLNNISGGFMVEFKKSKHMRTLAADLLVKERKKLNTAENELRKNVEEIF